jgi:biotin carboxyl carrier protein
MSLMNRVVSAEIVANVLSIEVAGRRVGPHPVVLLESMKMEIPVFADQRHGGRDRGGAR